MATIIIREIPKELHSQFKKLCFEKEISMNQMLKKLMEKNRVVHKQLEGLRLDIGTPEGYLRAILKYAALDPELRGIIREETSIL